MHAADELLLNFRVVLCEQGEAVNGKTCKTEEAARTEAIRVYNQVYPDKPLSLPTAAPADPASVPAAAPEHPVSLPAAASCFPSRQASVKAEPEPGTPDAAGQKKRSGQWKGLYTIAPQIPGKNKPCRGYCFTVSASTGLERWIVDLRQPVHHWLDAHTGQVLRLSTPIC